MFGSKKVEFFVEWRYILPILDVVHQIEQQICMSRSQASQPATTFNSSLAAKKDKSPQYFKPQEINQISKQNNAYIVKDQASLVPQFPEGFIHVQLGLERGKQAQSQKTSQVNRQKRKREMNGVNPNSLMVLEVPENQQNQIQGNSSPTKANSQAIGKDQKFNQKTNLNPQKVNVKPQQNSFVVLEEDPDEQSVQANMPKEKMEKYMEERQRRYERSTIKGKKQGKTSTSGVMMLSVSETIDRKNLANNSMETHVKSIHNESTASIIHEPESTIIHTPPSIGSVASFIFSREKVAWRTISNPQYVLNQNNGHFVVNAKKQYCHFNSYYSISSTKKQFADEKLGFLGYLQGNFTGSQFNLYQKRENKEQLVATIYYKSTLVCQSTYRAMEIYIKHPLANNLGNQKASLRQLYSQQQNSQSRSIIKLINKQASWCQSMQCYTMNFHGKSNYGSIKNTILVQEGGNPRQEIMLFCKTGLHDFLLQIRNPLTPFVAMGIILSSFDFKLCCQ